MKRLSLIVGTGLIVFFATGALMSAQKSESDPVSDKFSIDDSLKKCTKFNGLFPMFQDTTSGTAYIAISRDKIGAEFIYFAHTVEGVLDANHFRGAFRDNKIFSIRKYFNKIEFVTENTGFYFDENNALSKAAHANIGRPVLISEKIVGENEDGWIIKADGIFLNESLHQVKSSPPSGERGKDRFGVGKLSDTKTKYASIRNYPENTAVAVEYVYEELHPKSYGSPELTDGRFVSITLQHTFIAMPNNDFQPRYDDPRVGFFTTQVTDMTSASAAPYRDVIHRWQLRKKDPNATISEPVEPIVWWIENTTPVEFRETIAKGALAWNIAFETAGFKNAIVVKVQPDDATWDAGDIRYNVMRWTSSPTPPFGGYGPSFVNPRTGQILGADIMLEYVFMTNRFRQSNLYDPDAQQPLMHTASHKGRLCSAGNFMHNEMLFGLCAMGIEGFSDMEKKQYLRESLMALTLHEVGHTLGLMHNMRASQLHSPDAINNVELTGRVGLVGSVMDYYSANVATDRSSQGQYFTDRPGPYDLWAIEFGYAEALADPAAEKQRMGALLARSTEPELAFGNDADDMRTPGIGIDPRVMIGDMTGNAITYAVNRIGIVNKLQNNLVQQYAETGESRQELMNAWNILTWTYRGAVAAISRYIGGVYVDRAMVGQPGGGKPFQPVAYKDQKRAMNALAQHLFAPNAFDAAGELYQYLLAQRRGFDHYGTTEDPKIHSRALGFQRSVFDHILHPNVLGRLSDSQLYGNTYELSEFMDDLRKAVFEGDAKGDINTFRQNLQLEFVHRLLDVAGLGKDAAKSKAQYDYPAQSIALYTLNSIRASVAGAKAGNTATKAHREHITFLIDKAKDAR